MDGRVRSWRRTRPAGPARRPIGRDRSGPAGGSFRLPPTMTSNLARSQSASRTRRRGTPILHPRLELQACAGRSRSRRVTAAPLRKRVHRACAGHVTCASPAPTVASSAGCKAPLPAPPFVGTAGAAVHSGHTETVARKPAARGVAATRIGVGSLERRRVERLRPCAPANKSGSPRSPVPMSPCPTRPGRCSTS
jgi:hypothetical protein